MNNSSLKILQIIDALDPGGAERMAVNLSNEFFERGIESQLVASRRGGVLSDLVLNRTSLKILGKRNTFDISAFFKLQQIVRKFRPQVIHAHGTSLFWGWALKKINSNLILIWHDHLGISQEVIKKNPRREIRWLGKSVNFVITANQPTQEYWQEQEIWPKERVVYLPNFPSLSIKTPNFPDKFTFVHLANYRSEKGQKHVLHAAKLLKDQKIEFKIRMVGKAVDLSWKEEVNQLWEELELQSHVSLESEVGDVGQLLAEVNAGLVASDREGLPVALLEYGLAGLPVISSGVGQCEEVLGYGLYGHVVAPGDHKGLALAMKKLVENKNESVKMGQNFRSHVNEHFGASGFVHSYLSLISNKINFS